MELGGFEPPTSWVRCVSLFMNTTVIHIYVHKGNE